MNYRTRVFIVVAITAVLTFLGQTSTALAQEGRPVLVSLAPFANEGTATVDLAHSMSKRLAELLDADPRIDVVPDGKSGSPRSDVRYQIKGVVYSEDGGRHFLALKVVDAQSGKTVWFDNYDYRGISPDMIAPDVIHVLVK